MTAAWLLNMSCAAAIDWASPCAMMAGVTAASAAESARALSCWRRWADLE